MSRPIILALPKGRILGEVVGLMQRAGIEIEREFDDEDSRQLRFTTNHPELDVVRVRNFDVATFVAFGAAHIGVAGNDVLMEFEYPEIYAPLDLKVGHCRLVVAAPAEDVGRDDPSRWSHVRIATKYPEITRRHFAARTRETERGSGTIRSRIAVRAGRAWRRSEAGGRAQRGARVEQA